MSSPISETAPAPTPWPPGSAASSSSSPEPPGPLDRVGRDGSLRLAFARRGSRTVLTERRFTLPLQALEPVDLDGTGVATLMLLNPTGGVLGGDVLDTCVTLGPRSRVCLTTPAAMRVYRSAGAPAVQRFSAVVDEGAALEYLPDHFIPSPGARLRQRTEVMLAAGATLILLDAWAAGRVARGEAWRFQQLDTAIVVRDPGGLLLAERAVLDGARGWDGLGGTEGCPYVASFVVMAPEHERWEELAEELSAALDGARLDARHGVTRLRRGGLLARLLCASAPALSAAVELLWARARLRLLGLGPLSLRKF